MVTRDNMIFYSVFIFFLLIVCIEFQYCSIILTNKKIIQRSPFLLNGTVETPLGNIKKINNEGIFIVVYSNDNKRIILSKRRPPNKAKECQKKLIELLNKGDINE